VYPNISAYLGKGGIKTATELATRLLHEAHVVTVPGEAFGTGEHIRISYPVTKQNIDEGTRRMGEFLTHSDQCSRCSMPCHPRHSNAVSRWRSSGTLSRTCASGVFFSARSQRG
jgi:hypothetical protein